MYTPGQKASIKAPLSLSRIMVLDAGRIVEYAPPGELLDNKKSSFYFLAKDAGLTE